MIVKEILNTMENLAPAGLASSWDNVGLQIGLPDWRADKILLTLDVTPEVIQYAVRKKYNLILSHHPYIFRPVSAVTRPETLTLIEHKIAVLAMHTNLDVVTGGVNSALAEILGLQVKGFLSDETGSTWYHGSVTVPPLYLENLAEAIHQAGAGKIGLYDKCSTRHGIIGTYRSLEGSKPFTGTTNANEKVKEVELEFMVDSFNLNSVKKAIRETHPYETPAVFFLQTQNPNPGYGLGLICEIAEVATLKEFAQIVKTKLKAPFVQLWTAGHDKAFRVKRIAVCGGAGGSLINKASGQADVFVTGDINYHAMLDSRIPLINAGHFYTEYPVLTKLQELLVDKEIQAIIFPSQKHEVRQNILL